MSLLFLWEEGHLTWTSISYKESSNSYLFDSITILWGFTSLDSLQVLGDFSKLSIGAEKKATQRVRLFTPFLSCWKSGMNFAKVIVKSFASRRRFLWMFQVMETWNAKGYENQDFSDHGVWSRVFFPPSHSPAGISFCLSEQLDLSSSQNGWKIGPFSDTFLSGHHFIC